MAQDLRWHWVRLVGGSLLVLAAAHAVPRAIKPPELDENRKLAMAPVWPPRSMEELRTQADAWMVDHFPARPYLVGGLNWLRMQAGVSGSKRVIAGRDGWLFYDDGTHFGAARNDPGLSDDQLRAMLAGLAGRTETLKARGVAYAVISPPDKETLFAAHGPAWYVGPDLNRPAVTLTRLAAAADAGRLLYLHDALAQDTRWGLHTYARGDTHWTGLGAYLGYAALMSELQRQGVGDGPLPLTHFTEVGQDDPNRPRNLALMLGVASFVDRTYPEFQDRELATRALTVPLGERDDWTAPHVIETGQADKPVLLLTMDSFSNALVPFLLPHFSKIVVSHIQDGAWRPDLIDQYKPDAVVLETVEGGLPAVLASGPPASAEAQSRIAAVVARREALKVRPAVRAVHAEAGEGNDVLNGGDGNDVLNGKPGDDTVDGRAGDDAIRGGRGRDLIRGGAGDDWLAGGRDDDTLSGGAGADTFNSFSGAGSDIVTDFRIRDGDHVQLDVGTAFQVRQEGDDTVVAMEDARLVLKGVNAADLPDAAVRN